MKRAEFFRLIIAVFLVNNVVTNSKADIAFLGQVNNYWQVFVIDEESRELLQVTNDHGDKAKISWYPDGKSLLINELEGRLYRYYLREQKKVEIVTKVRGFSDAVLSPDGMKIAFSLSTAGSIDANNIWMMNSDGSQLERIVNKKNLQHEPSWGPKSLELYYLSGQGGQEHNIWVFNLSSRNTEALTSGQLYNFDVDVSQSGQIAYSSNRHGTYEIRIKDIQSDLDKSLTEHRYGMRPSWSRDESEIAYVSLRDGIPNIWILSVQNPQEERRLTGFDEGARMPVWYRGNDQ
ncbi:MAG: hypothetical protein AAF542_20040 [Pseudomonadota bacterium]